MRAKLEEIKKKALESIEASESLDKLNDVRVNILGKKGELTAVLKSMKDVAPEDRPKVGQMVNEVRVEIETFLENAKKKTEQAALEARLAAEEIDVTLPAKKLPRGHRHPNTTVLEEVENISLLFPWDLFLTHRKASPF